MEDLFTLGFRCLCFKPYTESVDTKCRNYSSTSGQRQYAPLPQPGALQLRCVMVPTHTLALVHCTGTRVNSARRCARPHSMMWATQGDLQPCNNFYSGAASFHVSCHPWESARCEGCLWQMVAVNERGYEQTSTWHKVHKVWHGRHKTTFCSATHKKGEGGDGLELFIHSWFSWKKWSQQRKRL